MGTSILRGCVKKINIINRTGRERWHQEIQILVSDIEMNNENLIEVRRFRPDEIVEIELRSAQLSLFDQPKKAPDGEESEELCLEDGGDCPIIEQEFRF
ncbi:hypothetical protein JCM19045_4350 [Bacillus sp. JCM 19045]|uniref:Uncharacterized protein n=1 Tax=Shouchella xiaoxiensis TaxID=766895 RepID=A0ABS2SQM3_9BACI|nr:hypothetical protein [Shouchella xiaoxiensis]MBM7837832.1 hypothetical protein [Shouchella xiaoxiensis]GAF15010.1 hypothetical protein JCM19045_4350 [Bacillus sp. JCM 19045]